MIPLHSIIALKQVLKAHLSKITEEIYHSIMQVLYNHGKVNPNNVSYLSGYYNNHKTGGKGRFNKNRIFQNQNNDLF